MATRAPSVYAGDTTGITPLDTEDTSWAEAFWGKVQNQAAWQVLGHTMDLWGVKPVEGYDPFSSGDIKGYERYADDFAYVSSPREASLLKARIDRNNAREAAAQEELGFFGTLLTEAFNPVNYIPLPGLTGLGFAKGALVGGASVGALSLAEEAVRGQFDPTVNPNDLATNAMYSSIFGGLLGGGFGMIGAKSANKLASEAVRDFNVLEQAELGLTPSGEPIIRSGNLFQARPTGDTKVGTASAGGFEQLAKLTPYGRLKNMGIRAVEDLADALGGDFGTLSARNRVGGATQTSAFLSAELWRGQAAEAVQGMQRAYQLFRTGGDGTGAEVLDVNLPTAIQRIREFLGKGQSGDGMLGYEQFKAEVFKAALSGKTDDLPVGIKEGVEQVRKFFDYAGVEGSKTGLIRTAEGFKRMLASKTDRARQVMARYEELAAKAEIGKVERKTAKRQEVVETVYGTRVAKPTGEPLPVYHGTGKKFDKFQGRGRKETSLSKFVRKLMLTFDWGDSALQFKASERGAIWFTNNPTLADDYARTAAGDNPMVREAYIDMRRPLEFDARTGTLTLPNGKQLDYSEAFLGSKNWSVLNPIVLPMARQHNADGIILRGVTDAATYETRGLVSDVFIAFKPDQIKLVDDLVPNESGLSHAEKLEMIELARQQDEALKWFEQRQRLPEDEGLRAIVERVDAELEAAGRKTADTIADLAEKSATRRADAEAIIADIEARIAARAERDQRIIEELRAKYETEGLTQAQIDYLDLLEARQFDGAEGSLAQQSLKQRLTEALNGVDRRAQEAERLIDGFDFSYNPDAPIGAKVYHGTREGLETFVDAEGNLVLRPSENFGGQQIGVSFGVERNLAADYATRAGDGRNVRGATVFEIDTSALPKLEREAMGEAFIPTDGDIVIPAGRWQATDAITKEDVFGPPKVKDTLTPKQRDYLDLLEARLAKQGDEAPVPKNEDAYLPRFWRLDKVLDDEAGPQVLRKVLFDWFKKNPLPGARIEDEFIEARVEEAIKTILKEADSMATHDYEGAGAQFLNRRKIDIPNELVLDFIETDVEQLVRTYAEKFGLLNEYTRFFGEANATTAIDDVILQAARELNPASLEEGMAQLRTLRGDIETLRDSVTGAIYSSDPAMMNLRRLNGLARNWATLTSMGSVAFSQIVETGRQVMVNGFGRSFGFALNMLETPAATKGVSDELRFLTGEGIDVLLSTGLQRFVDPGGPSGVGRGALGKFADKVQQATNGPFFLVNGLAMLTDITKRSNLVFINQFMMEDALKLAAGKGTKKDLEKLASYGLSLEDAKKIATMPFEKKGRVILPNVGEWPDEELARRYLVAVTGMSRRIVPTASAADLPLVARGFVAGREFPLLTLPFQFMNYGFASLNKIMLSALQGRDASPFKGAALLMGLAYMSQKLRTDEDQWERMDMSEKLARSFDQSGLTGVFSDIPSRVERASMGDLSLRGSLGLKPTVRNPDDWSEPFNAAGPVPGKVAQLVRVSIDGDATDRERANAIRRSIPLNNLIWWREGFDELETMATEE